MPENAVRSPLRHWMLRIWFSALIAVHIIPRRKGLNLAANLIVPILGKIGVRMRRIEAIDDTSMIVAGLLPWP